MTDLGFLIWFIAMAVMTLTVLTIGTLAAADILPRRRPTSEGSTAPGLEAAEADRPSANAAGEPRHHPVDAA